MARIARCNTPSPTIPARDTWASQQMAVFELHMLNFNLPNNYREQGNGFLRTLLGLIRDSFAILCTPTVRAQKSIRHPMILCPFAVPNQNSCTPEFGRAEQRHSLGIWRTRILSPLSYLSETVSGPRMTYQCEPVTSVPVSIRGNPKRVPGRLEASWADVMRWMN